MFSFYFLAFKKILGFLKKAFIVLAVYFIVISLFFHFINKDKPKVNFNPVEENRQEIYKVINDPKLKNTKEGQITIALYRGMLCGLIGEACTDNPKDGDKNFDHSLFGFVANLIVLPYANPPASGIYWAYSGLQNAGFIPKAYAAEGIGFSAIRPLISIWKIFRDLSYVLLVIVLIAIGFMIMFRAKINPQTVITVENSLPKIIVSLILITFSFAIVGFLIDLMYILIAFTISFLEPGQVKTISEKFTNAITGGPGGLIQEILSFNFHNAASGLLDLFPTTIKAIIYLIITAISVYLVNFILMGKIFGVKQTFMGIPAVGGAIGFIVESLFLLAISPIVSPFFISLLTILTAVFLFFRIFFILFRNYIELLIYTIFSPLILMIESVPGRSSFSFWFKKIFFNIFVFYLVFVLLNVTKIIGYIILSDARVSELWRPPFLYNIGYQYFPALVVLGILFITPDIVNVFKQVLGVKDTGISFGLGTFFGGVGAALGGFQAGVGMFSSFAQAPFIGGWLQRRAEKDDLVGRFLKGMLGPSQGEIIAQKIGEKLEKLGGIGGKSSS